MEEILKYIVSQVVNHQEDIKIETVNEDDKTVVMHIYVNPEDLGRVIGKGGKLITAIRTIIKTVSSKSGKRYIVKVDEK